MNYLLDTIAYLWMLEGTERFSKETKSLIENSENKVFVSSVTATEISIKESQGILKIAGDHYVELNNRGLESLSFTYLHGQKVSELPLHHKDPFDRMLIAQAFCEQMVIITNEQYIKKYPILTHDI